MNDAASRDQEHAAPATGALGASGTPVRIAVCLKWVAHPGEPDDERFSGMSAADASALEWALRQADTIRVRGNGGSRGDTAGATTTSDASSNPAHGHSGAGATDPHRVIHRVADTVADTVVVTAITVGPAGADRVLRDALSRGATRAVRIEGPKGADSVDVATALAAVLGDHDWIWCGDYSADRGTGSVPAFLAAATGARQALGVIHVDLAPAPRASAGDGTVIDTDAHTNTRTGPGAQHEGGRATSPETSPGTSREHSHGSNHSPSHEHSHGSSELALTRRLDGGRRELLAARAPAVVSVEGATAPLRRASLPAVRSAAAQEVEVVHPGTPLHARDAVIVPYRPRARVLPAPAGDDALERLRVLTDAAAASAARGETLEATPAEAAARIVAAARGWGYLD